MDTKKEEGKKYVSFALIFVATLIIFAVSISTSSGDVLDYMAYGLGECVPGIIIGLLFAKFLDKNASREKRFQTFAIAYFVISVLAIIGNFL